ncbi:MAG: patatin-like phospholipase family protein [Rubrivivax sp.]|nr:patatin-like phospholipase family protein [Rubrivivax sp.]
MLLQGGGALGAYHGGVFEGIAEAGFAPDWVVGISIGAINAALIAGNPPQRRVERLHEFWHRVSAQAPFVLPPAMDFARPTMNRMAAASAMFFGIPGFFRPRVPPPQFALPGTLAAMSYYDTEPLRETLDELVDFDRVNSGDVRLSLGAVNARTGESVYFDTLTHRITASHVMASGALPPGFPPVEIDGEFYFDGGIMSNTPLQYAARDFRMNALIVTVDLFSGLGGLPQNLDQVQERVKDIQFQSKTRFSYEQVRAIEDMRSTLADVIAKLPATLRADPQVRKLEAISRRGPLSVVHLVNRCDTKSSDFKDYEFSRATVEDLWAAGRDDAQTVLRHPQACRVTDLGNGVRVFDLRRSDHEEVSA